MRIKMMMRNKRTRISGSGIALISAVICLLMVGGLFRSLAPDAEANDDGRIRVTTTVGMIADIVRNVGGDRVAVTGLMGPGVDPHLYKASASDVEKLSQADIVFYGGLHLEGRMTETFAGIERSGKPTYAVTDDFPEERLLEAGGQHDPHVWFDVQLWMIAADTVTDRLSREFPADAATFRANVLVYQSQLAELDAYVQAQAERVPQEQRVLVTAHDAFSYFGKAYGFEVNGLQGLSTASEAGAGDVQDLIDFIVERRIPAIFVESSVSPSTIEAVQEGARARGWEVAIGGQLYSDAMGEAGTADGTYIGMVKHNIDTIVGALLGEPATPVASEREQDGTEA